MALKVVAQGWPAESRRAAQVLATRYGEPTEACHSTLTWDGPGRWKRIVAHRQPGQHNFPGPHGDRIECFIDFHVPPWRVTDLVRFDGSIVVCRTLGEVSARCHDEETNFLALNLAHDIISGKRSVDDARRYFAHEFLEYLKGTSTPYTNGLRFEQDSSSGDPDDSILSEDELRRATSEGKKSGKSSAA